MCPKESSCGPILWRGLGYVCLSELLRALLPSLLISLLLMLLEFWRDEGYGGFEVAFESIMGHLGFKEKNRSDRSHMLILFDVTLIM